MMKRRKVADSLRSLSTCEFQLVPETLRKIVTSFVAVLIVIAPSGSSFASGSGGAEYGFGYGSTTSNELIDSFSDALSYPLTFGSASVSNENYSGAVYLEYRRAVADKLTAGMDLVYERNTKSINFQGESSGTERGDAYTIALVGHYNYVANDSVRLFSGLGIGYTLRETEFTPSDRSDVDLTNFGDDDGYFNFQLTGLGVRAGEVVGFSAELGFGYKGILSVGVSFRID